MIYGKLDIEGWRTACVGGEAPESSFEDSNLRLFFFGILYNRDTLQATPAESNARIAARVYASDPVWGFSRLDGSFIVVYYSERECGVVRDHHGTHSSVYYTSDGAFSTSWHYLVEQSGRPFVCDRVALSSFLQRGILREGCSVASGVHSLAAGARVCMNAGKAVACPYVADNFPRPHVNADKHPDVEAYARRYRELHADAIRRRIRESRKVGILLSGGYDSGSNLAALRSIYDGRIDSYSVGFKGDSWSELPMARLMSDTFGTRHHEYEIDGSEIEFLPEIVRFLGEPFVEGGLMVNYCAMRMIGDDKPDVILGGDGSDQYFGTSGREVALHHLLARFRMLPAARLAHRLLGAESCCKGGKCSRVHFHLDKVLHVLDGDRFGFSDHALRALLQHPKEDFLPEAASRSEDAGCFERLYADHALRSDLSIVIDRVILYKASRMAHMFGNRLEFPFVDLELYRFLQDVPVGLKCKGDGAWNIARGRSESKYLLKHCYKPLLPEAITARKKQGGFAPMPLFFADRDRRSRLQEFILSSGIFDDYLDRAAVERFLADYDREAERKDTWFWYRQNKALQYFNLLTLAVWWEEFVEKK